MKAIINLRYSSKVSASIRYFANAQKVVKALDALNVGVAVGRPKDLAALLLYEHHDITACKPARTFIISAETPKDSTTEQLKDIDAKLEQAFFDLKKFLGGLPMLGWLHGNTSTRHLHGVFPNSDTRRGLNITPQMLSRLHDFAWTRAFESGRGQGKRKALTVYPHARKLAVRDLAEQLIKSDGTVDLARWDGLQTSGIITDFRIRKDGSPVSFEFNGKRIRVTTLQQFLAVQQTAEKPKKQNKPKETMPVKVFTPQLIPPDLANDLGAVGFQPHQLQSVCDDIRALQEMQRTTAPKITLTKSKNLHPKL